MGFVGIIVIQVIVFGLLLYVVRKVYRYAKMRRTFSRVHGVMPYSLLGNVIAFKQDYADFFEQAYGTTRLFREPAMMRLWLGLMPTLVVYGAEEAEAVLNNVRHINKSISYKFLQPWLGFGLLTENGNRWRQQRKLLTPTFHYEILRDFMPTFNGQARILIQKLTDCVRQSSEPVNMVEYFLRCALDIICESAMGCHVNTQEMDSEYLTATRLSSEFVYERQRFPWLWPEVGFNVLGDGRAHSRCISLIHKFTRKVIVERRNERNNRIHQNKHAGTGTTGGSTEKHRVAFLDLLLDMEDQGQLNSEEIRQQVDTLMFAGHDTTATNMSWAVYLLGCYPDIQRKAQQEVDEIFGADDRDVSYEDLASLDYVERCIKETLRMFPSVPMFARKLHEDMTIKNYEIPEGTQVIVFPYALHRDPVHWPNPEHFDPDRFLPEENAKRHPFAYIPFSAGSRNCIGQRFALFEEKVVLSWLLRRFTFRSVHRRDQVRPIGKLVLKPQPGAFVHLERRMFDKNA